MNSSAKAASCGWPHAAVLGSTVHEHQRRTLTDTFVCDFKLFPADDLHGHGAHDSKDVPTAIPGRQQPAGTRWFGNVSYSSVIIDNLNFMYLTFRNTILHRSLIRTLCLQRNCPLLVDQRNRTPGLTRASGAELTYGYSQAFTFSAIPAGPTVLQKLAYNDIAHLDVGFPAWTASGNPTESAPVQ